MSTLGGARGSAAPGPRPARGRGRGRNRRSPGGRCPGAGVDHLPRAVAVVRVALARGAAARRRRARRRWRLEVRALVPGSSTDAQPGQRVDGCRRSTRPGFARRRCPRCGGRTCRRCCSAKTQLYRAVAARADVEVTRRRGGEAQPRRPSRSHVEASGGPVSPHGHPGRNRSGHVREERGTPGSGAQRASALRWAHGH